MPAGQESGEDLKTTIGQARKKPLAFGLCLGKKADTTLLMTHKTKSPSVVGQQARKAGETSKFTFGMMSVKGKNLMLTCEGDVPAGMARKTKEYLKSAGFPMKVVLLDKSGATIESDGDDDEEENEAGLAVTDEELEEETVAAADPSEEVAGAVADEQAGATADDGPDPRAVEWAATARKLEAALEKATEKAGTMTAPARERYEALLAHAANGAYDAALGGTKGVVEAIKAAMENAAGATKATEADRDRWENAQAKMQPIIDRALEIGAGDVRKIEALWNFAKTKAEAETPDYPAAIKTITMLVKLVEEARAAQPAAADAATSGASAEAGPTQRAEVAGGPQPAAPEVAAGGDASDSPAEPAAAAAAGDGAPERTPEPAGAAGAAEAAGAEPAPVPAASAPEPTAPADLTGTILEKITRGETRLTEMTQLMTAYDAIIPGSAEGTPADWTAEKTRISTELDTQKAAGAAADVAKVDTALKDIVKLETDIRAMTAKKADWKAALELFQLRLVPLDHHAQAGATPEIKPKVDAIKTDLAKAEADAAARKFDKAIKALPDLGKRCDSVAKQADEFAHYATILAQREGVVNPLTGTVTGVATIDALTTEMTTLLAGAKADAAAGKFGDGVKKLDKIPPLADKRAGAVQHEADYQFFMGGATTAIANIDAHPANVRDPMKDAITELKKDFEDSKFAKTADYSLSRNLMVEMRRRAQAIDADCTAHASYLAKLTPFETQLAAFDTHKGRAGIEEFFQSMQRDHTSAKSEAAGGKFSTAESLLDRSQPQWIAQKANADACEAYGDKRDAVKAKIDGLRARPEAADGVAQADALVSAAAVEAVNKQFAMALATVAEAEARADAAKTAADAQDALGALKDEGALDGMAADFDAAYKVFTDMRANVVAADSGNAFAALIAKADPEAQKAKDEAGKPTPDYAVARTALDAAIALLEDALPKILASGPFNTHLADARTMATTTLTPLNVDDCIKDAIADVTRLADEAEALAKPEGYDFAGGEAKLVEAMAVARKAQANGAMYPGIKTDRAAIVTIKALITPAAVATLMAKTVADLDKLLKDIDDALKAGDFKTAAAKGRTGAAMQAAVTADVSTCTNYPVSKNAWVVSRYPAATSDAAKPHVDKAKQLMTDADAAMAAGNYSGGYNVLSEGSWAMDAAIKAQTEAAAYTPAHDAAKLKLDALKALDCPPIAERVAAIQAKFDAAVQKAADGNYFGAERDMKALPAECDALMALAASAKAYDTARIEAEAARTEIEGHAQADAIRTMIDRLAAKYESAVAMAATDDFANAAAMMGEIKPAAEDAKTAADHAAIFDGVADAVGGLGDDEGPAFGQITAAKAVLGYLQSRDDAAVASADLTIAENKIAFAEDSSNPPADRTNALKEAMDATKKAEEVLVQHRELLRAVETARGRIDTLSSHAQAAYVAEDVTKMKADLDAVVLLGSSGTDFAKATTDLNGVMDRYAEVLADADGQVEFLALRAKPELDARLDILERHDHAYSIRTNIDAMRAKIVTADEKAAERDHESAIAALNEAIALGTSALVMADMHGNTPPTPENIKAIINGPGGLDELDAMIDQLEPDAQRAVIRVAFEARFGCALENWQGGAVAGDGAQTGPDIQRFYQIMSDLPGGATMDNDSFRVFRNEESGGSGSRYSGTDKAVIMDEGPRELSAAYLFGREDAVGEVDEECEPANEEPVTYFSWNTLHEVGHAVDDQHGFMNSHQSGSAYGGWQVHGRNPQPVADAVARHFKYDPAYVGQRLAKNASPAIPDAPSGVSPEEWESRRIEVEAWISMAAVGNDPWASMSSATRLAIGGRVYQESYIDSWTSYELAARSKGITGYQFRAPGEWFSELYAAYHSGKLKDTHPSAGWLSTL